jgi:hypothetical protein
MLSRCSTIKHCSKEVENDHILGAPHASPYWKTGDHVARELEGFSLLDINQGRVNSTSLMPCLKPKRIRAQQ